MKSMINKTMPYFVTGLVTIVMYINMNFDSVHVVIY